MAGMARPRKARYMGAMDQPADSRAARAWLMRQARGQRAQLLRPVLLGLAGTACALAGALLLARLLATLLGLAGGGWADLALAAGFALLGTGLAVAQERAQLAAGEEARRRLRRDAFAALLELGPLDTRPLGAKAVLLVDRIEAVDGFFSRWLPAASLAILSPLLVLLAVAWLDPVSALVLLVMGLLVPVAMALAGIGAAREARRQMAALDRLGARFLDRLRGLATLVQFNRAEAEAQALGEVAAEFRRRTLRVLRVAFLSTAALEFLAAGSIAYLAWRHGALLTARGGDDAVTALFCILAVPAFFLPLRQFSAAYHEAQAAAGAAGELRALLEAPPRPGLALESVPPRVALAVTDLSWRPDPARPPAVDRLTFAVAPGETLLLMGPSGSGKTSILRLLMAFARPDGGRIALNGQDALRLAPAELRRMVAFVGQKPHLFAGTLRDNILLARPGATAAQLDRAAEAARVTAFAAALPAGLDTRVGEGGFGLSGGQAQRVALARAFLRDAPLVLLDEPTAHLDPATEAELVESIARLVAGRTAIIASHSPAFRLITRRVLDLEGAHVG